MASREQSAKNGEYQFAAGLPEADKGFDMEDEKFRGAFRL
jgi:hypothetical protein